MAGNPGARVDQGTCSAEVDLDFQPVSVTLLRQDSRSQPKQGDVPSTTQLSPPHGSVWKQLSLTRFPLVDPLDIPTPRSALEGKHKVPADAYRAQIAMVIAMPCAGSPGSSSSHAIGSASNQQPLSSTENQKGLPHLELGLAVVPLNLENLDNLE